jgi:hypothetical protein
MKRASIRAKIVGCSEAPHCYCRFIELPNMHDGLTLEARLIRALGWVDSLGEEVRITIEKVEPKKRPRGRK